MLINFALQTVINAVALWVAAWAIPGITFGGGSTGQVVKTVVIVALIFGIVNVFIKPILKLISLPFIILTLGLFVFIVNALMLAAHLVAGRQVRPRLPRRALLLGRRLRRPHHHVRVDDPQLHQDRLSPLSPAGMP